MNKFFNSEELHLLDTILAETKGQQKDPLRIKKEVVSQLNINPITSNWRFIKQYQALKYLNLV
jgi:hypothetical protein